MKVNYFVNESESVVVCKLSYWINGERYEALGVARCAPEDEFDVELGMNVASNRAHREYHNDHKQAVLEEIRRLKGKISMLENEYLSHDTKSKRFKNQYKAMNFGGK